MNCEKCGKELNDNSSLCSNCDTTINTTNALDIIANAGILTIIAAAFSLTLGVISLLSYQTYVDYYTYYGYDAPNAYVFWIIAGLALAAAAFGFLSSTYALQKKRFALTLIGPVLMVISGIALFALETAFALGYSDGFTVPAVPAIVLSVVALVMLFKSKLAFVDYEVTEDNTELFEPSEDAKTAEPLSIEK